MKTDTTKATIASIYLQETEIYFFPVWSTDHTYPV